MYFSWLFCPLFCFSSVFSVESVGFDKSSRVFLFFKHSVTLKQEIFDISIQMLYNNFYMKNPERNMNYV